jgi:hypothetical protein
LLLHLPLFNLQTAQQTIVLSCLRYLNFGADLVVSDDEYDENSRVVQVAKGFHGLCRYATKLWAEHLLAYLQSTQGCPDSETKTEIMAAVDNLAITFFGRFPPSHDNYGKAAFDSRCELLKGRGQSYAFVKSALVPKIKSQIAPKTGRVQIPGEMISTYSCLPVCAHVSFWRLCMRNVPTF